MTSLRIAIAWSITLAAASVALGACATTAATATTKEAGMDTNVTLLPKHSTALGSAATLRFERIEDSRCPPGMRCVWAGKLSYHFTLEGGGASEAFALDQAAPAFSSVKQPGVKVELASAEPPPVPAASTTATPVEISHPVTLHISRQ